MKRFFITGILLHLAVVAATAQPDLYPLLEKLKNSPPDTGKVILYGKVSNAYEISNVDSSLYYANQGLELSKKLKFEAGEGRILQLLGIIYFRHKQLDSALIYFNAAMPLFKKSNFREGIAKCYNSIGIVEGQRGYYNLAIKNFLSALDIYKADKNEEGQMETYLKLGLANELSKHEEEALRYYVLAKAISDKSPVSNMSLTLLNNIGILYGRKGEYEKALGYFEEGIKHIKNLEFNPVHIALLTDAGNAYSRLGDKKKALSYYQESYAQSIKHELPEERAHALINMASNLDTPNWAKGIVYLKEAMQIAEATKNTGMLADIYHSISEVYATGGLYRDAYLTALKYHALSDSMLSKERSVQITEMQAKYKTDEAKAKIAQLELANQKTMLQRNLFIVAIVGVCIIIGILWSYYRKVNKLNRELKVSNNVKDKLFSVIGHDLRSPLGGIVQTLELLENNLLTAEESKDVIKELKIRGEGAYEILTSMLLWGKSQLQGTEINMIRFNPKMPVEKTIQALNKQAKDKNISICNHIKDDILLMADIDHFDLIIRNLLSNAIKFSFEGGTIELDAKERNDKIIFSVSDHGVGISLDAQQEFLNSNLQVNYGTKGEKGTGIGLLLIKEYVTANKGRIWLESSEGTGTTFYFSLTGHIIPAHEKKLETQPR